MLYICNIRFYISSKDAFLFSLDNPVAISNLHLSALCYPTIATYCRSEKSRIYFISLH